MYIYIYIYIYRERERNRESVRNGTFGKTDWARKNEWKSR